MTPSASPPAAAPHLTIGAVARAAGIAIDTIRYYEREGLLPVPARRLSGYRDYTPDAVARLRFIRRAKELGFTLEEIRELLALGARQGSCRLGQAANGCVSASPCVVAIASRSGLSVTAPIGVQLRVRPDHREGWRSRAWV